MNSGTFSTYQQVCWVRQAAYAHSHSGGCLFHGSAVALLLLLLASLDGSGAIGTRA